MTLAKNAFTRALAAGDKQVGLWINLCSNFVAKVTAPTGYDWAFVEMEHSPNDYFSVLGQMQAFAAGSLNERFTCVACGTDASLMANASDHLLSTAKDGLS